MEEGQAVLGEQTPDWMLIAYRGVTFVCMSETHRAWGLPCRLHKRGLAQAHCKLWYKYLQVHCIDTPIQKLQPEGTLPGVDISCVPVFSRFLPGLGFF